MATQQKKVWETPSVSSIGSIEQLTGQPSGFGWSWGRGGWQNFVDNFKANKGKNDFCPDFS